MVGAVSPVGLPSGAGSSSMGLGAGFHLLGHFCGQFCQHGWFILGAGLLPRVDGQFCGHFCGIMRVARGVDIGAVVVFDVAQGGPVLVVFEARCSWSGRRSQRGARWEERPGFALVGARQGRR